MHRMDGIHRIDRMDRHRMSCVRRRRWNLTEPRWHCIVSGTVVHSDLVVVNWSIAEHVEPIGIDIATVS